MLGLLLLPASEANADLVNNIGLYDGTSNAPTAWISYTGSNGPIDVYADPQTATNWTSNGSPIPLYCIDLVHDNYLGTSYNVNSFNPTFSTTSSDTDAANRVAWALENAVSTAADRGATQLLIWSIIGPGFSVTWNINSNSALQSTYNALVTEMGSGYNPSTNYLPGAEFLGVDRSLYPSTPPLYQDLAYAVPVPGIHISAVAPEPSTLVIAGLGALGLIGYGWRRRRQSSV